MEQIRNYVEALFSSLPKTKEVIEMKLNMLENLEEKYNELLAEGTSTNEAIGITISQIGSIEEFKKELGIEIEEAMPENDEALQEEFFAYKKRQGLFTAIAVALFILAPATIVLFGSSQFKAFPIVIFFIFIATAVGLLIYSGAQEEHYKRALNLDKKSKDSVNVRKDRKNQAISSVLWICTVIVFLLLGFQFGYWHPGWIVFLVAAAIQVVVDYWSKSNA